MKRPSLKEVKEYFKHAEIVACLRTDKSYSLNLDNIKEVEPNYMAELNDTGYHFFLWSPINGYAEIVAYKDSLLEELPSVIKQEPKPDFKKITDSLSDLLEYKNKKYGNSALEPMSIFNNKCKVGQRLDDKLARIKNGTSLSKNDVADLMGYLALTCVEFGWDNFDEFKD